MKKATDDREDMDDEEDNMYSEDDLLAISALSHLLLNHADPDVRARSL